MIKLFANILRNNTYNAEDAYNLWADTYDQEQNNLMLYYDDIILNKLLSGIEIKGKLVLDYGCGTGRNWPLFYQFNPDEIIGCDVSAGMLKILKSKYSSAETFLIVDNELPHINNKKCDIIISSLVIAHIKDIDELLSKWNNLIKNNADIVITDFHPSLLAKGGTRTFSYNNKTLTIKNYIHTISEIEKIFSFYGFKTISLIEKHVEEDVKHFYAAHNALHVYNKYQNTPFIYGIHFSRTE